jgi:hypothetical protein
MPTAPMKPSKAAISMLVTPLFRTLYTRFVPFDIYLVKK